MLETGSSEQVKLQVSVIAVVYLNDENGYTVLRVETEDGEEITAVGILPPCVAGERLLLTGHWESHVTHGTQLRVEVCQSMMPADANSIEKYLASGAIKGIGAKIASRIVRIFGQDTLRIMEQEPMRLQEVPGISPARAEQIGQSFQKQFGVRKILEYFMANKLPTELAMPLFQAYGDLALDALEDDPYLLTDSFFGAEFPVVDAYAIRRGIEAEDERRLRAATLFNMRHNLGNGHTYLPADKLCEATASMLSVAPAAVDECMRDMNMSEYIVIDHLKPKNKAPVKACYLPEYYKAEAYVAERLLDMAKSTQTVPSRLDGSLRAIQKELDTTYAKNQLDAIRKAAESTVMLLTGGPGTGKTTTVNGILALFERLGIRTVLTAPTGRAAKRMSELCGREASTIHRLLETQYSAEDGGLQFSRNEEEPLDTDAVIVDETSMVDIILMDALLRAMKPDCRLILVGDPDQLPSVGAGCVFSDLIESGNIPMVRLTEIFRQAQESLIVMNAHAVNQGQMPELTVKNKDFFFLPRRDISRSVTTMVDLCARRLPQNMGIPPEQIQVLSPTRKNDAGTANLNLLLQAALNPPSPTKRERKHGKFTFREGDRVMQIKNNYDIIWTKADGHGLGAGVFNGDVGKILEIDPNEETMTVQFDDKSVEYSFDLLGQLELAYAMTVHKSQGSEYRAVILSVSQANPYLLTRSILYTAITRARELLILVGDPEVIAQMVKNNRQSKRFSGLISRLQQGE